MVNVKVYCVTCEIDLPESSFEMKGEKVMFENERAKTQARTFRCPSCGHEVSVVLTNESTKEAHP